MRRPRRVSRHLARQPFGTRRVVRCPSLRTRQGPLPVPHDTSRHDLVPATPGSARQARGPSRALAAFLAVGGTPPSARYRECGVRCLAMRRRPPMLLRCSGHWRSSRAAFTRRALRPGNVACGDQCVRGTIAPRHHAGTRNLVSKALGATGLKADFVPRHYRIPPPGDRPWETPSAASGRRPVVTGRCASDRGSDEHRHGARHRLAGAGHRDAGPAGAATRRTLRSLSTSISRTRVALPGPSACAATIQPWAAGPTPSPPAPGLPRCDAWPRCRRTSSVRPSHQ